MMANSPRQIQADIRMRHELLRNEYQAVKRKLQSKNDALVILAKDLTECQGERDQYKMMADQLRHKCQNLKKQLQADKSGSNGLFPSHTTVVMPSQLEAEGLRQKLTDAEGDIKLLREKIIKHRLGTSEQQKTRRKSLSADERDLLLEQLESSKETYSQLEQDMKQLLDMKEELETERDTYKSKYNRLNTEVNFIMRGDEKHVVDIDAMIMENRFLQQRVKQLQEENTVAQSSLKKYKHLMEKKRPGTGILKSTTNHVIGGLLISQRQVKQLLASTENPENHNSSQMVNDLKNLAASLLETINDRTLALNHQRKSNKLLGCRITDLESKLHELEISGVESYSLRDKFHSLCELRGDCVTIRSLIPQCSLDSSELEQAEETQSQHSQDTHSSEDSTNKSKLDDKDSPHLVNEDSRVDDAENIEDELPEQTLDFSTPMKQLEDEYNQLDKFLHSDDEEPNSLNETASSNADLVDNKTESLIESEGTKTSKHVCFVSPITRNPVAESVTVVQSESTEEHSELSKLTATIPTSYSSMLDTMGASSCVQIHERRPDNEPFSSSPEQSDAEECAVASVASNAWDAPAVDFIDFEDSVWRDNSNIHMEVSSDIKACSYDVSQDLPDTVDESVKGIPGSYEPDSPANQDVHTSEISAEMESVDLNSPTGMLIPEKKPLDAGLSFHEKDNNLCVTEVAPSTLSPLSPGEDFELPPIHVMTDDIPQLDLNISLEVSSLEVPVLNIPSLDIPVNAPAPVGAAAPESDATPSASDASQSTTEDNSSKAKKSTRGFEDARHFYMLQPSFF